MKNLSRRKFISDSTKATAGIGLATLPLNQPRAQRIIGPSERVNLAMIGCGGRGTGVLSSFARREDVNITYLCDLHQDRSSATKKQIQASDQRHNPKEVKEIREVLESKDVDAVVIATPDHWHTPAAILACQTGKDVYVEKPFCHNIWEGRKLVEAARKYDRVVQVGTQNRSAPYNLAAKAYLDSGKLGDIKLVKVYNLKGGSAFHLGQAGTPPAGFDWQAWLGPARFRPYHQRLFRGGWHQFWEFSGGDLADDGIHQLDLAMMMMGSPEPPKSVAAVGGRLHHNDDSEVPDVEIIHYEYPNFVLTFELTHYANAMNKIAGSIRANDRFPNWPQCATRIEFYGSKEIMMLGRHGGGWQVFNSAGEVAAQEYGRHPDPQHQQNFIECIKTRKRPNADVEISLKSHTVMHMGNIALRVGNQQLSYDAKQERFLNHDEANKLLKRQNQNAFSVSAQV